MIKILQSTVERLLYYLVFLMFLAIILVGTIAYHDGQQIKQLLQAQTNTVKTLESNQYTNAVSLEVFIREGLVCTAKLPPNPNPTPAQIQAELGVCFPNTPAVK